MLIIIPKLACGNVFVPMASAPSFVAVQVNAYVRGRVRVVVRFGLAAYKECEKVLIVVADDAPSLGLTQLSTAKARRFLPAGRRRWRTRKGSQCRESKIR